MFISVLINFTFNFYLLQSLLLTLEDFGRLAITSELFLANIFDCAFTVYYFEENELVGGIFGLQRSKASMIWHLNPSFC